MKDVLYIGFASLSYLNWHKKNYSYYMGYKLKDFILPNNMGEKLLSNDTLLFYHYSEEKDSHKLENKKFKDFQNWEFIEGFDHKKLQTYDVNNIFSNKKNGYINLREDSGFQGSVFKKGNKVMIAFRGSDYIFSEHFFTDWSKTNMELGFNHMADQLICTARVCDIVEEMFPNCEIHITGHSLGGALAQFAHIYTGCKYETKTWNGLGIGEKDKSLNIQNPSHIKSHILKRVLTELGYLNDDIYTAKCLNARIDAEKIVEEYNKNITIHHRTFGRPHATVKGKINNREKDEFIANLSYRLKVIYKFQSNYDKVNGKLKNYYISIDLTANLQKRKGEIVVVDKKDGKKVDDGDSDFFSRKAKTLIVNKFQKYHMLSAFFPFLSDDGDIIQGKLNNNYVLNAIKTVIKMATNQSTYRMVRESHKKFLEKTVDKIKTGDSSVPFVIRKGRLDPNDAQSRDEYRLALSHKLTPDFLFEDLIKKAMNNFTSGGNWYEIDNNLKEAKIGKFCNFTEIGGVFGGEPFIVKIKENEETENPEENNGRRVYYMREEGELELFMENLNGSFEKFSFAKMDLEIRNELNNHSYLTMNFRVMKNDIPKYKGYFNNTSEKVQLKLKNSDEKPERDLFTGFVNSIYFDALDQDTNCTVIASSYSKKSDVKLKYRSFQDMGGTPQSIIENVVGEYGNSLNSIISAGNGGVNHGFLQYEETDWEFIKRVSASIGQPIISIGRNISIGFPNSAPIDEDLNKVDFTFKKDKWNRRLYNIKSYKLYNVGEIVNLVVNDEQRSYRVLKSKINAEKAMFYGHYELIEEQDYKIKKIYNKSLRNAAFYGKVVEVLQTDPAQLKVHFFHKFSYNKEKKVEENSTTNGYPYGYATPYSKTHEGLFCTPEVGDIVLLGMTNDTEAGLFVLGAVNNINSKKFSNPLIRYFNIDDNNQIFIDGENIKWQLSGEMKILNNGKFNGKSSEFIVNGGNSVNLKGNSSRLKGSTTNLKGSTVNSSSSGVTGLASPGLVIK